MKRLRPLVNEEITFHVVRVQSRKDGAELGTMAPEAALAIARQRRLDLGLSEPLAKPPICSIEDMSSTVYRDEIEIEVAAAAPLEVDVPTDSPGAPAPGPSPLLEEVGKDLAREFGKDRVVYAPGAAGTLDVPEGSRWFLGSVGLPRSSTYFTVDPRGLIRLDHYIAWWRSVEKRAFEATCRRLSRVPSLERSYIGNSPADPGTFYRFGSLWDRYELCLENKTGRVVQFDALGPDFEAPATVNSDVVLLARFLSLLQREPGLQGDALLKLRDHLEKLDPPALRADSANLWSVILEEMGYGL